MKTVSRTAATLSQSCVTITLAYLLLSSGVVAQSPKTTSTEIISPKSEAKADATIEPRKPSITEDTEESEDNAVTVDPATLLPALPPVPKANATMIGGTVDRIDRVRDRITVRVFGGGKENFLFDPRTQVYRGSQAATVADLREGERVYLDTILDGSAVFARTIRLTGAHATGTSQGVVLKLQNNRGEMTVRDALSPNPIDVRISPSAKVTQGQRTVPLSTVVPGSLISMRFSSGQGGPNTVTEISILAQPGTEYTFSGEVVHLDLRSGLIVLNSSIDHKTYEVYLPSSIAPDENLHPGATVTALTNFDGERYVVRNLRFNAQ